MSTVDYNDGLHQVADGVWAWLQPDGGWGLSNAGLVDGGGSSLLVDTQYDLPPPRRMLPPVPEAPHYRLPRPRRMVAGIAGGPRASPDRGRGEHPRQRRPLLRQRAARPGG